MTFKLTFESKSHQKRFFTDYIRVASSKNIYKHKVILLA